jgi:chorismate synthase
LSLIVEGLPAGLPLAAGDIDRQLQRRQSGYGRGGRMLIERDQVQITAGVRHGETLGSPLALTIINRDFENWRKSMAAEGPAPKDGVHRLTRPRPGHADLVGALKYDREDLRDILERASARETAARVAAGTVARLLLDQLGVALGSWVESIGAAVLAKSMGEPAVLSKRAEASDVHCPDPKTSAAMRRAIDAAGAAGDTLGGVFVVAAWGLVPGIGSHVQWDRRLDARLAAALMSIPAIKGVEAGSGFENARRPGSRVHDEIIRKRGLGYGRASNTAGGLEGGMTTGEPLWLRAAMKPIATLKKPLKSVDMKTKKTQAAGYERSDVCAVPAAAVVGEAMAAWVLAGGYLEKFGGDSLTELKANWRNYWQRIKAR